MTSHLFTIIGLILNAVGAFIIIGRRLKLANRQMRKTEAEYYHTKFNESTPENEYKENTDQIIGFITMVIGFIIQIIGISYDL
ncbi:MAG: hypothetical protein ACREAD_08315 [Nitrosopumilaceae archaeon]